MDEFDASAAPTAGREATSGRGADTPSAQPSPALRPAADRNLAPAPSGPAGGTRPSLAVSISRPAEPASAIGLTLEPRQPATGRSTARELSDERRPVSSLRPLPGWDLEGRPQAEAAKPATPLPPGGMTRTRWILFRIGIWARRAALYGAIAFAAWFVAVLVSIALFRVVDPPFSNLILLQRMSGEVVVQKWLPIERIPAQVIRAIVVSEDGRFCEHGGIDFKAIEIAIETSRDGVQRGASTITMQVAKNLYLWPSKSYVRKALEVPITLAIEAMWPKRRIFEVYANIAEWGPGIFGVDAAAGYHFGKSAGRVSEREAALLAVALPNPVTRDAGDPGPGTERLANTIQARMRAQSRAAACIERPRRI